MGWITFSFAGSGTAQADDAETADILELGTSQKVLSLPTNIKIVDIVADKTATNNHQRRIYVNGKAQGAQFFQAQINPATQGRLNFANQNIVIPKGSNIQMKGAQKDGTIEATKVTLQFQET